jgi:hypothetical protein
VRNSKIVASCVAIAFALTATGAVADTSARGGRKLGSAGPAQLSHARSAAKQAPDALARALHSDRLTRSEYALQRARSLFHLKGVRNEFGDVAKPGPRDATLILRDLALAYPDLSGADRADARSILARPTDGAADPADDGYQSSAQVSTTCSANFCFHWVTTTSDAVSPTDAGGNGLPDYIDSAISVFENVRSVEVGQLGFRAPRSDQTSQNNGGDAKTDIYFTDTGDEGTYGYCTSDDPALEPQPVRYDVSAYCTLDNDFNAQQFEGTNGLAALQVTAAHEYFHAIQYGYDIGEDKWLIEGSATWMEDVVYDEINDYYQYTDVSQMGLPHIPLDFSSTQDTIIAQSKYGAFLYFRFLSDSIFGTPDAPDNSFMREVWEHADSSGGAASDEYSTQAVASVITDRGFNFEGVYALFGVANLLPSSFYSEGAAYAENSNTPGQIVNLSTSNSPKTVKGTLDHLTHAYKLFSPGRGTRSSSRLRLKYNGPPLANGTFATIVVLADGAQPLPFALNASGDGKTTVSFGKGTVTGVALVMTNASRAFTNCFSGRPFSCQGVPRHENQLHKVTATLLR